MKRALIIAALLALPAMAQAQDVSGSALRAQNADRAYCQAAKDRVGFYAISLGTRIRKQNTDLNPNGYISPRVAQSTKQLLQDTYAEINDPYRVMMYQNPNRAVCQQMADQMAKRLHDIAMPVLNEND